MNKHTAVIKGETVTISNVRGTRTMKFSCSPDQYHEGMEAYKNGKLMQDAFPFLSADEREFLISGMLPDEWERLFGKEE